jgi:exonuclease SbcC
MILTSIYARNFQKYEEFYVDSFPAGGFIGILGENESGKSTILEMVSFALYGRTLKADEAEFMRLIHWRSSRMEVRLGFMHKDQHYALLRKCDREGDNTALAFRILADGTEETICEGSKEVRSFLYGLFPVSFMAFRHSFYLGQKELGAFYERRNSGSSDVIEELTGISRLKQAHEKTKLEIPQLHSRIDRLERELAVLEARREMLTEQLQEKEQIERDLERQKSRLAELGFQLKEKGFRNEAFDRFRARIVAFKSAFEKLEADYIGCEFMKILTATGREFLSLWQNMKKEAEDRHRDIEALDQEIKSREGELIRATGLHAEIKVILALVRERIVQIERELKNQFGATNFRSHFIPSTLQERNVLCEHQLQGLRLRIREDEKSFNLCLAIFLTFIGFLAFFVLRYGHFFITADFYFRLGSVLFAGASLFLLSSLLYGFHRSVRQARDDHAGLQMNFGTFQRETETLSDEFEALRHFEQDCSFRSLQALYAGTEYPSLKKALSAVLEKYPAGNDEDCSLEQIKHSEAKLREIKEQRKKLIERRDSLRQLEVEFVHWHKEITNWGFVGGIDSTASSGQEISDYASRYFEIAALILKLRQFLQNDFSFSSARFMESKAVFESSLQELLSAAGALDDLPGIWDPKLLHFNYISDGFGELTVDILQSHARKLAEQRNFIANLIAACIEKHHCGKEGVIRQEADRMGAEQRICFMEEALYKLRQVAVKTGEIDRHTETRQQELGEKKAELARRRVLEDLLRGTIESMQARLSPALSRFIGHILPSITDDRYAKVRVSRELEIEVFSPEKDGYIDLMSLSGGTADQLLICLRLAFASSLLQSAFSEGYQQFLFLDEPLYAFDAKRADNFLEIVRSFSSGLSQVFVVTHNHNLIGQMGFVLEPKRDSGKLILRK